MTWICNLLLTIIATLWSLWVCGWGHANYEAPFLRWFLKCWEAKEKSGCIAWNEFLAIMKYLTFHYAQHHEEAERYYKYTDYVDMTPFIDRNWQEEEKWDYLVSQLYMLGKPQKTTSETPSVQKRAKEKHNRKEKIVDNGIQHKEELRCIYCGRLFESSFDFCPYCGKSQIIGGGSYETTKNMPTQTFEEGPAPYSGREQIVADEQTPYEWAEEKKSKTWIWVLVVVLLAGAGAWYFLSGNGDSSDVDESLTEVADSMLSDDEVVEEDIIGAHSFLEQFYKEYGDEAYLLEHITANVKNKLRRDYEYDCETNDCLAAWVFTAYPAGADLKMEEGPIISETDAEGRFKVDFKYSGYDGDQKIYDLRTVFLTVSEIDGKYLISDYEIEEVDKALESLSEKENEGMNMQSVQNNEDEVGKESHIENQERVSQPEANQYEVRPQPIFPGGDANLRNYISRNMRYPVAAEENGIQGIVSVQFVVERDGSVSNARIVNSVDPSLDREALRLVKSMPRWTPASNQEGPIASQQIISVSFRL